MSELDRRRSLDFYFPPPRSPPPPPPGPPVAVPQSQYNPNAFDVPSEQSTGVGWANRVAEGLTTPLAADPTLIAATASPLVNITQGDIDRALRRQWRLLTD